MKAITSLVFHIMMFPFNGNVVTLDQISYYNPNASYNPDNVFATVMDAKNTPYLEIRPGAYRTQIS